ncbi:siderophore-iron reductase FhuF [Martelella mangrovi]|uniref:Ferric iron reductase protein FhuF n=1 Tax=Martelella mangrovi TaxID=1397477 RepID=A0ABV2IDW2_9HYPH
MSGDADRLTAMLDGPLALVRAKLSLHPDARPAETATELLEEKRLSAALARHGNHHGLAPDAFLLSLWSQKYLAVVIIPYIALSLLAGRPLRIGMDEAAFVLDETGEPVALRPPEGKLTFTEGQAGDIVPTLYSVHLEPAIARLKQASRLSEKALWGNAAHYLEWAIRQMERHPAVDRQAAADALAFLSRQRLEHDKPNPLKDAIHYIEEAGRTVRRRKVCCLRYRVPGVEGCGTLCPDRKIREASCMTTN